MKLHDWIDRNLNKRGRNAAADLARALGISADKVTRMRKGQRRPTAEEMPDIEAFFGESAPSRQAAPVDEDADRTSWIERNMLGDRDAAQQRSLHYLVYYTKQIAEELERIAVLLEEQRPSGGAATRPEGRTLRSRNRG